MRVMPYDHTPEHLRQLREVCISQASERARTSEAYAAFTLLMYCDPYLEHGIAYMLVDDEDRACGYVLSSGSIDAWERAFAPYRARIEELGPEYARRVADEYGYYRSVADAYPAHLHIDIAEDATGHGHGRALMETLLARLREEGVAGVSFGVSESNERAIGFYRHMGFTELAEYDDGAGHTFAMRL